MPLIVNDEYIRQLVARHLTSDDGEVSCVVGLQEPVNFVIVWLFLGPLFNLWANKQVVIALTKRRLLLIETSLAFREKHCESIDFNGLQQVSVVERSFLTFGNTVSIVRLKVPAGKRYRVTIHAKRPGLPVHEQNYRKVIAFFKSLERGRLPETKST